MQPFVKNLSKPHVLSDGLPVYRRLQSDDQDSVRLLTVEDLIVIAQQLTPPEVKEQLLKQIRHSVADKSWRVRYMAATHFNEVYHPQIVVVMHTHRFSTSARRGRWYRAGQRGVDRPVCATVERQRGGSEDCCFWANSRYDRTLLVHRITLNCIRLAGFSKLLEREVILARVVPCVRDLSHDTSQHVRAALANQISGLAPLLGREATVEHLLPLFLHLLKDEFPEVRLNVISKLETVNGGMKFFTL
jgi:serine/threonine-protein phosphatase 2A regulatory subunit A